MLLVDRLAIILGIAGGSVCIALGLVYDSLFYYGIALGYLIIAYLWWRRTHEQV